MLQALKISYFEDLLDLEPGDRWWPRLETAIDQCDLFLLFWSSDAIRPAEDRSLLKIEPRFQNKMRPSAPSRSRSAPA